MAIREVPLIIHVKGPFRSLGMTSSQGSSGDGWAMMNLPVWIVVAEKPSKHQSRKSVSTDVGISLL